jgi:hypothetical protein
MAYSKSAKGQMALEKHLSANGWVKDQFGHFKKRRPNGDHIRIKMQANSCRFEKQVNICGKNEWRNCFPGQKNYYKNFHVVDGKMSFGVGPEVKING